MRVDIDPRLPQVAADKDYLARLNVRLYDVFRATTTGTWNKGDRIYNTAPSELGTGGSKYVIEGWQCITGGTPGTWVQMRYLTGN